MAPRRWVSRWTVSALAALSLAACGQQEFILPGEREPVRPDETAFALLAEPETDGEAVEAGVPSLTLPPEVSVATWEKLNGSGTHLSPHAALGQTLTRVWSRSIGAGSGRRQRMTSGPVASETAVFAIDAAAQVSAVSREGEILWQTEIAPEGERASEGFGGGLALGGATLFVASGFGETLALDTATGAILWRSALEAPSRVAPAVGDEIVVAIGANDVAFGFDRLTGETIWRLEGFGTGPGLIAGGSPALRGPLVILPFQTGGVTAALVDSGRTVWTASIAGGRRGLVRAQINDISGDPVIDNDIVYAANQAGRMVSLDRRSGERNWTLQEGAYGPALPVGGSLFVVSDGAELVRIDAETGARIWTEALPEWRNPERRRNAIPHFGPLLAGGRLLVLSGDGVARSFDPVTGQALNAVALPGPAAAPPAIAGGLLFVVTEDGRLHAYQ